MKAEFAKEVLDILDRAKLAMEATSAETGDSGHMEGFYEAEALARETFENVISKGQK